MKVDMSKNKTTPSTVSKGELGGWVVSITFFLDISQQFNGTAKMLILEEVFTKKD